MCNRHCEILAPQVICFLHNEALPETARVLLSV